jgi:hypothetical protein
LPSRTDEQLRQEFVNYLSHDVEAFATIEKSAKEKIITIILSQVGMSLENHIDYFKCLVKYMKSGTRIRHDDRECPHPANGRYVYYPIGSKEYGKNNFSSLLLALYFCESQDMSFTIYDCGLRR